MAGLQLSTVTSTTHAQVLKNQQTKAVPATSQLLVFNSKKRMVI